ncbi:MAG: hypothetical protein ABL866_02585 [Devosia sp.]
MREIFGGTVVGYVSEDGTQFFGKPPTQCLDERGDFRWWDREELSHVPSCSRYLDVSAALFRVDVPIVGPAAGELATFGMHWGDGDCDIDFSVGEEWLIVGHYVQEEMQAPIPKDKIATLQRMAAGPVFDMSQLYR